ncbi:MAG: ROK family protein [Deltaproteobacteria bacterium]|nr:ROK family protein [Deltaproteobacteria bacterium]
MSTGEIAPSGALGIDIGGHGVKGTRVDRHGVVQSRGRIDVSGVEARDIERIEQAVQRLVDDLDPDGRLPVGVGVPGFHDQTTGLLRQSPNFPGWEDKPVGARLSARLERRVQTENDANCALLGEAWVGAARGLRNVVMLTLGTGVGSGFLVGGTLLTGARGAGAEAGHIRLHRGGRACGCGRRGCLEQYVSGPGFVTTALEEFGEGAGAPARPEDIFDAAKAGADWAMAAIERFCVDLADGLTPLVHVFSPASIVLGGGVANAFPSFAPRVEELLGERAIPACLEGALPLRQAGLGGDAGAVGAARLVLTGAKHGQH